jgi:hypothetical protein
MNRHGNGQGKEVQGPAIQNEDGQAKEVQDK